MSKYQTIFVSFILFITCLNLILFIFSQNFKILSQNSLSIQLNDLYQLSKLINSSGNLFVIEPQILANMIEPKQLSELRWRYNLPFFTFDPDTITMAMFNDGKVSD